MNDVSFEVPEASRFGIIGPNGARKTTLFNLLSGETRPTEGKVRPFGRDVTRLSAPGRVRLGLGRTFQVVRVFADLTVRENLTLALNGLSRSKLQMLRPRRSYGANRWPGPRSSLPASGWAPGSTLSPASSRTTSCASSRCSSRSPSNPGCCCWTTRSVGLSPAERVDIQALLQRLP